MKYRFCSTIFQALNDNNIYYLLFCLSFCFVLQSTESCSSQCKMSTLLPTFQIYAIFDAVCLFIPSTGKQTRDETAGDALEANLASRRLHNQLNSDSAAFYKLLFSIFQSASK